MMFNDTLAVFSLPSFSVLFQSIEILDLDLLLFCSAMRSASILWHLFGLCVIK